MAHYRADLRNFFTASLPVVLALDGGAVTARSVLSPRLSVDDLPELVVQVSRERPRREASAGNHGAWRRAIEINVVVRRRGADVADRLDRDHAVIEHSVMGSLRSLVDSYDITLIEAAYDTDGGVPVGQLTVSFEAVLHTRAGPEQFLL